MSILNWGIVGLGGISHKFVKDLQMVENNQIVAVASRSQSKAQDFATHYGVKKFYGSYRDLFADKEVDIVYIATPHDSHAMLSIEAMGSKKHVLCEKPVSLDAQEAKKLVDTCKAHGVLLMEAFMYRMHTQWVTAN